MRRILQANDSVNVSYWDTCSSSSTSSGEIIDLLNLNIKHCELKPKKESEKNYSVNSDSGVCAQQNQHQVTSCELGSSYRCRSTSLQSFHFPQLTKHCNRKSKRRNNINENSPHRNKEALGAESNPQNKYK
ncbi:hypothetical protein L9F63_021602, partial [Diploptera punctata]